MHILKDYVNFKYLIPIIVYQSLIYILKSISIFLSGDFDRSTIMLMHDLIMIIFLLLFFKKDLKEENKQNNILKKVYKYLLILLLCNLSCSTLELVIQVVLHLDISNTNQAQIIQMFYQSPLTLIISSITAGFIEEMIYRYNYFKLFKDPKLAFVTSWLIFAMGHIKSYDLASLISLVGYLLLSYILTDIYYKNRDIRINILVHTLNNTLGVLLFLVAYWQYLFSFGKIGVALYWIEK